MFHGARALSRADKDDDAIVWYRKVVATYPRTAWAEEAQFLSGWLEFNRGKYARRSSRSRSRSRSIRTRSGSTTRCGSSACRTMDPVTRELVRELAGDELEKIRSEVGDEFFYAEGRPKESRELFEQVALSDDFVEFLTLPAYDHID